MRILVLALALFGLALTSYGQNIYQIRADSVRIYNDCDTAEFILENHTQMVPGFLYNRGRGRTEFRRLQFLNLGGGLISIGDQDTLDLGAIVGGIGGGGNSTAYIKNQLDSAQVANYRINGSGTQKTLTLTQDVTKLSPLIMLGNGDTLVKAGQVDNLFMGGKTGLSLGASAAGNVAFGYNSMNRPTGNTNAAFGSGALQALTGGNGNIAVGGDALKQVTTGSLNIGIGVLAGTNVTTGSGTIAIGYKALNAGGTGVAIGNNTLVGASSTTSNIGVGSSTLGAVSTGTLNIGMGSLALGAVTTGTYNIAIGNTSGTTTRTGSNNIFVGSYTQALDTSSNVTMIGNYLKSYKSNVVLIGGYKQNVVIGPNSAGSATFKWDTLNVDTGDKLQVNGSAFISGKVKLPAYKNINGDSVLTTDANGNLIFTAKGGGSSSTHTVANLQNVTDTGNVTNNAIVLTGNNNLNDSTGVGMHMYVDNSTEYNSRGLRANIKVYDYNTSTPGHLYVTGKGLMVENPENYTSRVRMHPENDGFHIDAEYLEEGYSWYQTGQLMLNTSGRTIIGGSGDGTYSVNIDGALATRVERSRNIASDYMSRDAVTYLIVDNTTTTIKMYEPTFCPNRIVTIKKTVNTTTPIKIVIDGAGLIDGQTSITITDYLASVQLQSDGTNYWILYRYKN